MKVFLSSTAQDLVAYRKVADDTILRLSREAVVMERFGPLSNSAVDECERLARESDVIVCIVAHRFGFVPEKGKGSITRREVEAAKKAGKEPGRYKNCLAVFWRAELHRFNHDYERAERDLAEVLRIATRSGMGLYLADYHLESARLQVAQGNADKARESLTTAKEMIERMGYHRRDKEVDELEQQLGQVGQ